MDIKKIFNIILLAISLSTILITIVSFLIFKFRQLVSIDQKKNLFELEGSFFRRYAPHLERINEQESLRDNSDVRINPKVKVGLIIFLVVGVITSVLLFEDYFLYRKEIKDRISSAETFRLLIKDGLLRTYEFDSQANNPSVEPILSRTGERQVLDFQKHFEKEEVCLVSNLGTRKFGKEFHEQALIRWKNFFEKNKIKFSMMRVLNIQNCTYIFPHIRSLNEKEISIVKKIISTKKSVVTGSFGEVDGFGKEFKDNFLKTLLKDRILVRDDSEFSQIVSDNNYIWDIPSGIQRIWSPINSKYGGVLRDQPLDVVGSSSNGEPIKVLSSGQEFYLSRLTQVGRVLWSALDPDVKDDFSNLVFLSALVKHTISIGAQISHLPGGEKSTTVFTTFIDDPFSNLEELIRFFKRKKTSFVFFTNSKEFELKSSLLTKESDHEVALIGPRLSHVLEMSTKANFFFLEDSRIKLEELTYAPVRGILPAENFVNGNILNAVSQNKFMYLLGGKETVSSMPFRIRGSYTLYFPRSYAGFEQIISDRTLFSEDAIVSNLLKLKKQSEFLNGVFVLNIPNSLFKEILVKRSLSLFIDKNEGSIMTLGQIAKYQLIKDNLRVSMNSNASECLIELENDNKDDMYNLELQFYRNNEVKRMIVPVLEGGKKQTMSCL